MKNIIKLILSFIFVLGSISVYSQDMLSDSVFSKQIDTVKLRDGYFVYEGDEYVPNDTTLTEFQHRNKYHRYDIISTGNINLISREYIPYSKKNIGFQSWTQVGDYKKVKYAFSEHPVTIGYYSFGSQNQQNFNLFHTQNFGKLFQITIDFDKVTSNGFYFNNKADLTSFNLSTSAMSKNKKFVNFFYAKRLKSENQVNGGLTTDTAVLSEPSIDKSILPVRVNQSSFITNDNWGLGTSNYFFLTNRQIDEFAPEKYSFIKYQLDYSNLVYRYTDQNIQDSIYDHYYFSGLNTNDKVFLETIKQSVNYQYSYTKDISKPRFINFGVFQEYNKYQQTNIAESFYNNYGLSFSASYMTNDDFKMMLSSNYIVDGYNKNDYDISFDFGKDVKYFYLSVGGDLKKYVTDFEKRSYYSNNFIYSNNFDKEEYSYFYAKFLKQIKAVAFGIGASYYNFKNYIYLDSSQVFNQAKSIDLIPVKFDFQVQFNKYLYLKNNFTYNVNKSGIIPMPSYYNVISIRYSNPDLFKGDLRIQTGIDFTYHSSFEQYGFTPALSSFSNQSELFGGAFPLTDFHFSMGIGKARIMMQINNVFSGLIESNYFSAKYYLHNDRTFMLTLDWRFEN